MLAGQKKIYIYIIKIDFFFTKRPNSIKCRLGSNKCIIDIIMQIQELYFQVKLWILIFHLQYNFLPSCAWTVGPQQLLCDKWTNEPPAFVKLWLGFFQTNQSLSRLFNGLCWTHPLGHLGFYSSSAQLRNFPFTGSSSLGNQRLFPEEIRKTPACGGLSPFDRGCDCPLGYLKQ